LWKFVNRYTQFGSCQVRPEAEVVARTEREVSVRSTRRAKLVLAELCFVHVRGTEGEHYVVTFVQPDASDLKRMLEIARTARSGEVLSGTINERHTSCGHAGCRCMADRPQRHGPYYLWTKKVRAKTVGRWLPHVSERPPTMSSVVVT
jgi:hypothetical protein